MAEQLLTLFADVTTPPLGDLRAAVEEGDPEATARIVHQLKGSCQNMGANAMAEVCVAFEQGTIDAATAVRELDDLLPRTLGAAERTIVTAPER